MSLKNGDFGLNPEHPPFVKLIAVLPLLPLHLQVPTLQHRSFKVEANLDGKEFAAANMGRNILFRVRLAASVFALALALLVFLAAQEMFGTAAAFITLTLLVFDPNLLANGALVTTDVGISCFLFASVYALYRYVRTPSLSRAAVVGLATGLALASKNTGLLLLPMFLLLAIYEVAKPGSAVPRHKQAARFLGMLAFTTIVAVVVLWAFYGFRYQARPAGQSLNPTTAQYLQQVPQPSVARVLGVLAHWKVLPESYLYGLADLSLVNDAYASYFFGKVYPHGVWFYFPGVIAVKSTLPFLILLGLIIFAIATHRLRQWKEIRFLAVPAAFYLAVAMSSHMNIGVRHILPMYIFLYVLAGGAAYALVRKQRGWIYVVAILLAWQAVSSIRAFPTYLAFANELWGGAANTHKYLGDANVDWGQQLIATDKYLEKRGVKDCWFVYFAAGVVDPSSYGIPCKQLPTIETLWWLDQPSEVPEAIDGTVLVSAGDLNGIEFGPAPLNPYEQFKTLRPTGIIQYGVYVYDGRFEIPLASALSHAQIARNLLAAKEASQALQEAQQAVALSPNAVFPNEVLGDVLEDLQRPGEARLYYQKALTLCNNIRPEFQRDWVPGLAHRLAAK